MSEELKAVIPPELIELALDVLLPLIQGCFEQKTPEEVIKSCQAKDPVSLYYLRRSIRKQCDWQQEGKKLYDTLVNGKWTDSQVASFVNDFHKNKLDYLDLV